MKRYKDTEYFVTEDGKVIGLRGYELKLNVGKSGYVQIRSSKLNKTFSVHRMIAETYIPNPQNKPDVNHWDGDKTNNNISNLFWATKSENMQHSVNILGKKFRGTLTDDDVKYIKENYKPRCRKFGAIPLGNKFGISKDGILYHIRRK